MDDNNNKTVTENSSEDTEFLVNSLKEYVDNMIRIRALSSPDLPGITNAEAYSYVL